MSEKMHFQEILDYKNIFESSPNLYLLLKPDFTIIGASDAYLQATMIKRDNVLGLGLFEVFPDNPDDPVSKGTDHLRASLERVLSSKRPDPMAIQKYDVRRPQSEGGGFEERYWSPLNSPVLGPDGEVKYIIHRVEDITEIVKLKKQGIEQFRLTEEIRLEKNQLEKLRQSQRLEAMGALASGVAHDFNNILAVILITCEKVLNHPELSKVLKKDLNQIVQSSEKAAALTRQLLAFSRKQILQPKVLDLNETLMNIKELLSRLLKEDIEIKTILAADLKNILVDQGQLEQIVLNLVVNARDAMPTGGKITIETANVVLDSALASGNMYVEPGPYVMLAVRDTGIGMDAKTQARIFEPFFTTKEEGKGTGLGLATLYGIVSQNKGCVWVYSEPNNGSVFKIFFPQCNQVVEKTESIAEATIQSPAATETLLVVEDQEPLRQAVCASLRANGYKVYDAENGKVALAILAEINYKVDLILSDVIMPEMGGPEMAKRLTSLGHKIKILFLSGFAGEMLADYKSSGVAPHFLEKPFNQKTLISKIKSVLQD